MQKKVVPVHLHDAEWVRLASALKVPHIPSSYVEYFAKYGLGTWGLEFEILPPIPGESGYTIQSFKYGEWPEWSERHHAVYTPLALLPNELYLVFDYREMDAFGEPMIRIIDVEFDYDKPVCFGLDSFLGDWWMGLRINDLKLITGRWDDYVEEFMPIEAG